MNERVIYFLFFCLIRDIVAFQKDILQQTSRFHSQRVDFKEPLKNVNHLSLFSFFKSKDTNRGVDIMNSDINTIKSLNQGSIGSIGDLIGCWKVIKIIPSNDGKLPTWTKYSNLFGKFENNSNYQIFFLDGSFLNLSEYVGENFYAIARGRYMIKSKQHPAIIDAKVNKIAIGLFKKIVLTFNITGTGQITLLFLSNEKRVLESEEGARVIQQRVLLPKAYENIET